MMWLAGTSKAYAPLALGLVTRFLEDRRATVHNLRKERCIIKNLFPSILSLYGTYVEIHKIDREERMGQSG